MAVSLHQDSSPYLNDLDYSNTSPSSAQHNISPHQSPFDQFEFSNLQSSNFPHTPSYNGSYHNSPYSGHSDLSFGGEGEQPYGLFDEEPAGIVIREDYDPSEYDPPSSGGLLMFDSDFMGDQQQNSPHVSVSVTPAPIDYQSPNAFDYSSPSSNGGGDSGPDGQPRSRGSSISSNHNNSNNNPTNNMASPRLDVTQGFENMRFDSPHWGTSALPPARSLSPPNKPQSPPQLLIPDSGSSSGSMFPQGSPPVINAPDGDGGLMGQGPQLHIVPATPVSGGGGTSQAVPFQTSLETLHQGSSAVQQQQQQTSASNWDQRSQQIRQQQQQSDVSQSMGGSQFSDRAQLPYNYPEHSHDNDRRRLSTSNGQVHPNSGAAQHNYLYPIPPPRSRSKSDTDLQPPQWGNMRDQLQSDDGSTFHDDDTGATVNLSDILPSQQHPNSAGAHQTTFNHNGMGSPQPPHLQHHFTFGPPGSANSPTNNFLSPDMSGQLRRSKSDSGSRPGHQRQSRSEDMRHSPAMMYPPSSQQEFISRQFLHPQESVPAIRGHHRRASSGSRAEGSWSGASSARPSPYPSPSASPRYRVDELPNVGIGGRSPHMLVHELQQDIGGSPLPQHMDQGAIVSKPNVTTGRTANASRIRRKQDANFLCPVPGCGSTFTRSFNLKGHMRSHNEEKPFQCKWPGCGKGFARQHDCKRHEQLHSNYRPFTCEGCQKNFARMDALNRHLRSEGGAECQRILNEQGLAQQNDGRSPPLTKQEESGWPGMSVML